MQHANWNEVRQQRDALIGALRTNVTLGIDAEAEVTADGNSIRVRFTDGSVLTWKPNIRDAAEDEYGNRGA